MAMKIQLNIPLSMFIAFSCVRSSPKVPGLNLHTIDHQQQEFKNPHKEVINVKTTSSHCWASILFTGNLRTVCTSKTGAYIFITFISELVGRLVDPLHFQIYTVLMSLDHSVYHRPWYIFWNLWPTEFGIWFPLCICHCVFFPKCIFLNCIFECIFFSKSVFLQSLKLQALRVYSFNTQPLHPLHCCVSDWIWLLLRDMGFVFQRPVKGQARVFRRTSFMIFQSSPRLVTQWVSQRDFTLGMLP